MVWNYGQYGLLGFLLREEIMQGIKTLLSLSSALQDIPPKDLVVGPARPGLKQHPSTAPNGSFRNRGTLICYPK